VALLAISRVPLHDNKRINWFFPHVFFSPNWHNGFNGHKGSSVPVHSLSLFITHWAYTEAFEEKNVTFLMHILDV